MLSTPNVSLEVGSAMTNECSGGTLTGYNNANYMAQLANAIYQADPSLFGIRYHSISSGSVLRLSLVKDQVASRQWPGYRCERSNG